jgi:hypothetical protein
LSALLHYMLNQCCQMVYTKDNSDCDFHWNKSIECSLKTLISMLNINIWVRKSLKLAVDINANILSPFPYICSLHC